MFPWQVFGLCRFNPTRRTSQRLAAPVSSWAFVPAYRCGAVPDFHRIPFSFSSRRNRRRWPLRIACKNDRSDSVRKSLGKKGANGGPKLNLRGCGLRYAHYFRARPLPHRGAVGSCPRWLVGNNGGGPTNISIDGWLSHSFEFATDD
jgi:hypothetical protein